MADTCGRNIWDLLGDVQSDTQTESPKEKPPKTSAPQDLPETIVVKDDNEKETPPPKKKRYTTRRLKRRGAAQKTKDATAPEEKVDVTSHPATGNSVTSQESEEENTATKHARMVPSISVWRSKLSLAGMKPPSRSSSQEDDKMISTGKEEPPEPQAPQPVPSKKAFGVDLLQRARGLLKNIGSSREQSPSASARIGHGLTIDLTAMTNGTSSSGDSTPDVNHQGAASPVVGGASQIPGLAPPPAGPANMDNLSPRRKRRKPVNSFSPRRRRSKSPEKMVRASRAKSRSPEKALKEKVEKMLDKDTKTTEKSSLELDKDRETEVLKPVEQIVHNDSLSKENVIKVQTVEPSNKPRWQLRSDQRKYTFFTKESYEKETSQSESYESDTFHNGEYKTSQNESYDSETFYNGESTVKVVSELLASCLPESPRTDSTPPREKVIFPKQPKRTKRRKHVCNEDENKNVKVQDPVDTIRSENISADCLPADKELVISEQKDFVTSVRRDAASPEMVIVTRTLRHTKSELNTSEKSACVKPVLSENLSTSGSPVSVNSLTSGVSLGDARTSTVKSPPDKLNSPPISSKREVKKTRKCSCCENTPETRPRRKSSMSSTEDNASPCTRQVETRASESSQSNSEECNDVSSQSGDDHGESPLHSPSRRKSRMKEHNVGTLLKTPLTEITEEKCDNGQNQFEVETKIPEPVHSKKTMLQSKDMSKMRSLFAGVVQACKVAKAASSGDSKEACVLVTDSPDAESVKKLVCSDSTDHESHKKVWCSEITGSRNSVKIRVVSKREGKTTQSSPSTQVVRGEHPNNNSPLATRTSPRRRTPSRSACLMQETGREASLPVSSKRQPVSVCPSDEQTTTHTKHTPSPGKSPKKASKHAYHSASPAAEGPLDLSASTTITTTATAASTFTAPVSESQGGEDLSPNGPLDLTVRKANVNNEDVCTVEKPQIVSKCDTLTLRARSFVILPERSSVQRQVSPVRPLIRGEPVSAVLNSPAQKSLLHTSMPSVTAGESPSVSTPIMSTSQGLETSKLQSISPPKVQRVVHMGDNSIVNNESSKTCEAEVPVCLSRGAVVATVTGSDKLVSPRAMLTAHVKPLPFASVTTTDVICASTLEKCSETSPPELSPLSAGVKPSTDKPDSPKMPLLSPCDSIPSSSDRTPSLSQKSEVSNAQLSPTVEPLSDTSPPTLPKIVNCESSLGMNTIVDGNMTITSLPGTPESRGSPYLPFAERKSQSKVIYYQLDSIRSEDKKPDSESDAGLANTVPWTTGRQTVDGLVDSSSDNLVSSPQKTLTTTTTTVTTTSVTTTTSTSRATAMGTVLIDDFCAEAGGQTVSVPTCMSAFVPVEEESKKVLSSDELSFFSHTAFGYAPYRKKRKKDIRKTQYYLSHIIGKVNPPASFRSEETVECRSRGPRPVYRDDNQIILDQVRKETFNSWEDEYNFYKKDICRMPPKLWHGPTRKSEELGKKFNNPKQNWASLLSAEVLKRKHLEMARELAVKSMSTDKKPTKKKKVPTATLR